MGELDFCWEPIAHVFSIQNSIIFWPNNISLGPSSLYHGLPIVHCIGSWYSLRRVCQNVDSVVLVQAAACLCSCMAREHGTRDVSLQMSSGCNYVCLQTSQRGSVMIYQFHLDLRYEWQVCFIDLDRSAILWTNRSRIWIQHRFITHCQPSRPETLGLCKCTASSWCLEGQKL